MLPLFAATALAANVSPAPPCLPRQIGVSLDARDGDFDGMSHSGTLLILRNHGRACRIEALPSIRFADAAGRPLPIARNVPPGMHPGPVMVPVALPAGGVVSTPLRWVSGEVYDRSRCFSPARIRIAFGGRTVSARFLGRLCGPAEGPAGFDQPPLRPGTDTSGPG